jgi:hypothetical protein
MVNLFFLNFKKPFVGFANLFFGRQVAKKSLEKKTLNGHKIQG